MRGEQKYQVRKVGVEKIKLSRLLVQRINFSVLSENVAAKSFTDLLAIIISLS